MIDKNNMKIDDDALDSVAGGMTMMYQAASRFIKIDPDIVPDPDLATVDVADPAKLSPDITVTEILSYNGNTGR